MDAVTQQNAALVEEAAAATQSLQDQSGKLAEVVGVFRLDGAGGQDAAPCPRTDSANSAPGGRQRRRVGNILT